MKSSLEIAQEAVLKPIEDIASGLGLKPEEVDPYGRYKAKISLSAIERLSDRPPGKIVCVAGITPTKAGEGKSTTAVGLVQGLGHIGKSPVLCLREASLGPVFGMKGGAAGGGYTQVVPMEDLNLHFTGDIHAIGAANNLLAALLEASILHGNELGIDPLTVSWRRAVDINDRSLRQIVVGLGGRANGYPRESGFDITAASEVMAITAVARDLADLRERLGRITVASTYEGEPVTAEDVKAAGAMAVLLREAIKPNLVQTLEGQPALMHCGPFANIAHGNSSLVADYLGQRLGDYVITESGFGADMGMEKFFDIVCRVGDLTPSAVALVCTVRALAHHGDGDIDKGSQNLRRHIEIVKGFGLPCVVAINRRPEDEDADLDRVRELAAEYGADSAAVNEGFEKGGAGGAELAERVVEAAEKPSSFAYTYPDDASIADKIEAIVTKVYGGSGIELTALAQQKIEQFTKDGLDKLPICMAKTQYSLSADPTALGAPEGFIVPIRDIRAYTGAGWLVPLAGDIMQMPGYGKTPAAHSIDLGPDGEIVGLF
ncbi:MAG TPA: formate--tetrahydrofolate ligase [Solirubrobacteraceae bacterium]|jgi:formate--tetrahydrofolate ligase|nr:formate--tetrahydrofolate ligase [Solirubrobacteraceae bacterium]